MVRRAEESKIELEEAGDLESVTARGVRSTVGGLKVEIGTLRFWEGAAIPEEIKGAVDKYYRVRPTASRQLIRSRSTPNSWRSSRVRRDYWDYRSLGGSGPAWYAPEGRSQLSSQIRTFAVAPHMSFYGGQRSTTNY